MRARQVPLVLPLLIAPLLGAQGTTTAAMDGVVSDESGLPIRGAVVRVTNESNGRRWETSTRSGGRFFFEDLGVGRPYRVEVRAVGFVPESRTGLRLSLGERVRTQFALRAVPITLAAVTVIANIDPVLNPGRVGPAEIVSRSRIVETPNHGRDFLTLTALSPQVVISPSSGSAPTGGVTIAGQNRLLNSFQVDGGTNEDLYTGGLPGRESLPRPISLEAIEEIQVLAAPFDVRHGGFSGGLVNAVTRSGGNAIHGSTFGFFQNARLTGSGVSGRLEDFRTWQYGGWVGGPIVRDRAHYFLSVDWQRQAVPDPGPLLSSSSPVDPNRPTYGDAVRFQSILSDTFELQPGTLGPVTGRQPAADVFGKIGLEIGPSNHLDISHHYAHGERVSYQGRRAQLYALSSTGQTNPSTANASSLIWTTVIGGRWSSELVASTLDLVDRCEPFAEYPAIAVQTIPGGQLWAGAWASCPSTSVRQMVRELSENATRGFGSHTLTLGIHGESLHFRDALGGGRGNWTFASLDDFAIGRASRYTRTLPGSAPTNAIDFGVREFGVYVQDRWTPASRLAVTLGLRLDHHYLPDEVATDTALDAALGVDIGRLPGGTAILSPRLGFNYDIGGDGRGYVRGGVGLFAGRVPYIWLSNAYRDNGTRELFLTCAGARVPPFDPVNQPVNCTTGPGPQKRVSFFDPGLKFPQALKFTFGVDHRLGGGIIGTTDLLYTRSLHQLYVGDANLAGPQGVARGEGNRTLYGTINALGTATTARRTSAFGQVIRISNKSEDHTFSLSGQLRKQFGDVFETSALYAFTRARDEMSLVNFVARQNLEHTPLDGTVENRALRTSYFEVPHRVQLEATARLLHGARLSLLYAGASGTPYTYVAMGDLNADGMPTSQFAPDIVYVPLDSADIALVDPAKQWPQLKALIDGEPCLRSQRGRILRRNSCRNPWFGTLNARASKAFPTVAGQTIELTGDVYNALNLLNRRWGLFRVTAPTPAWPLLQLSRYDPVAQRGVYNLTPPILRNVQDLEGRWSRWMAELSVRYVF